MVSNWKDRNHFIKQINCLILPAVTDKGKPPSGLKRATRQRRYNSLEFIFLLQFKSLRRFCLNSPVVLSIMVPSLLCFSIYRVLERMWNIHAHVSFWHSRYCYVYQGVEAMSWKISKTIQQVSILFKEAFLFS